MYSYFYFDILFIAGGIILDTENKNKLYKIALTAAIIFVILFFLTNVPVISAFFGGVFSVLSPLIIGGAIAYLLNPLLKLFEYKVFKKMKNNAVKRGLSILLTYISALLAIVGFLLLVVPQLITSITDLTSKFNDYVDETANIINSIIGKFSKNITVNSEGIVTALKNFFFESGDVIKTVMLYAKDFIMGLYVGVKNLIIGIFISVYVLISKERLHAQTRRLLEALFKDKTRNLILKYARIANRTFGRFFIGKIINSTIIGILTYILLLIFRIPYPLLIATVIGVTDIIPIFGPFIGAIPSAIIIFIADPPKALVFVLIILALQQFDGNVMAPKILGTSTGISSLGVIVAIVIMGECFGLVGMIVGVPVFAVISILGSEFIESRLKAKNRPTKTEDYYPPYSLVNPNEHHEKLGEKLFRPIINLFEKKSKKKTEENETQKTDADNADGVSDNEDTEA